MSDNEPILPQTDSIAELAAFWDTHDVTDFESELEDVSEPLFVRTGDRITLSLAEDEAREIDRLANARGVSREEVVHGWVRQHLSLKNGA